MANKAVAIVGMCGSGKSCLTEMFCAKGFDKVYFGGVTVSELKKAKLEINEQNERAMREGLRERYGKGAFAILLNDEIAEKLLRGNVVLDGLYSWSEYVFLKEKFGDDLILLAVVTDAKLRQERLTSRTIRPLSRDETLSRDRSEIENLEKGGPIAAADHYILNNGTPKDLAEEFDKFCTEFLAE